MYAVLFDLDTNCLNNNYEGTTYHNAYKLIKDYSLPMVLNGNKEVYISVGRLSMQ